MDRHNDYYTGLAMESGSMSHFVSHLRFRFNFILLTSLMCICQRFMNLLALHIYITYIHFILHIISQQDTGMEYNHVNLICFVRMVIFSLYLVVLAQIIFVLI